MDKLIQQLEQIEKSAVSMIDQANLQKQQLAKEYDEKKTAYEREVDAKTEEALQVLSGRLAKKREQDIKKLHVNTQKALVALNTEYRDHGRELASQILQRVLAN